MTMQGLSKVQHNHRRLPLLQLLWPACCLPVCQVCPAKWLANTLANSACYALQDATAKECGLHSGNIKKALAGDGESAQAQELFDSPHIQVCLSSNAFSCAKVKANSTGQSFVLIPKA